MPTSQFPQFPWPVESQGQGYEPQRQNLFVIVLTPKTGSAQADATKLTLYARSSGIPQVSIAEVEDHFMTQRYYHHGAKVEFSPLTTTFREIMNDRSALSIFYEWLQRAVSWQNYSSGVSSDYTVEGYMMILDHAGVPVRTYQFIRLWPTTIGDIEFTYDTGELVGITVTFRFDRYLLEASQGA